MRFSLVALAWLALEGAVPHSCEAAPRTVTITDPTGIAWKSDLVHYTLVFPPQEPLRTATACVESSGKAIPSQVSDVVRDDDGVIRSMNVWFQADVPADATVAYLITPGKEGPRGPGVTVRSTPETIELTTQAPEGIGIRLLAGTKRFDWPIPAAEAPGPIQGLLLPSGA